MSVARYLIFGDLHGRILPAFRLAMAWEREHGVRLDGLLQVGDLGYFPDPARLDKATARHAADDPLELGTCLVAEPNREADEVFQARTARPRPCGSRRATTRTSTPCRRGSGTGAAVVELRRGRLRRSSAASVTGGSRRCPARCGWGPSGASTTRHRTPAAGRPSGAASGTGA